MAKSVLGDDPFAGGGPTAPRAPAAPKTPKKKKRSAPSQRKQPPAPPRTKRSPPPPPTEEPVAAPRPAGPARGASVVPPLADGAAARRASRATASLGEPPPRVEPAPPSGQGLDPAAGSTAPTGSLADEIRRIEHHVARRLRGDLEPAPAQRASLLDRVGQLIHVDTYRSWLSSWMMRSRSDVVDDFGLDPVHAERWRPLLEFLYRSYWRVECLGMENLPDHGRALVVANHSGTVPYDGAMIMYAVRTSHPAHRNVRPLVEDFVFHFPFIGVALNRIGCVRACQENAERLLDNDQVAVVFPEGIKGIGKLYRDRYQLQRFGRGGFIKLALKTRAPIIPTAVVGAEEIHPMLARVTWLAKYIGIPYIPITPTFPWLGPLGAIPLPTKWTIRFGEPIDVAAIQGSAAQDDRILVSRLAEQVRSTIQGMIDETLTGRRSIVFG